MNEWFDSNEGRAYPMVRGPGDGPPDSVLADLSLMVPDSAVENAVVASVSVTDRMASVSVSAGSNSAAVTVKSPVSIYRPYALSSLAGSVAGFVVFGRGVEFERFSSRPSWPVDPRAVRGFGPAKVMSMKVSGADEDSRLRGRLTIDGSENVKIAHGDGVIKVGLSSGSMRDFLGPCDRVAALFDECGGPPLRKINGVGPDEDGILWLEVRV